MSNITTEQLLIKALLISEGCMTTCKHSRRVKGYGYADCVKDGKCINHSEYKLDIDKLKEEFNIND